MFVDLFCPVRNDHSTCYIAVYGLSIGTKLYTFPYHTYRFQKTLLNIKCVLSVSANLTTKFLIKIIQTDTGCPTRYRTRQLELLKKLELLKNAGFGSEWDTLYYHTCALVLMYSTSNVWDVYKLTDSRAIRRA